MVSVSVRLVALWMLLLLSEANLEVQAAQLAAGVYAVADEGTGAMPAEDAAAVTPMDEKAFPMDPAFAKLSAEDKAMFSGGTDDVSHFTGSMSDKESEFAETQGAETEMFGMSDEDQQLADDQSKVELDKAGQETVQYLTSDEEVSDDDLKSLSHVKKAAAARAALLEDQLADLQYSTRKAPGKQQQLLQHHIDAIDDAIVDEQQDDQGDLGESADLSATARAQDPGMKEHITKAKAKAKAKFDAINKQQETEVQGYTSKMKESIKKTDEIKNQKSKAAQAGVRKAVEKYDKDQQTKQKESSEKVLSMKNAAENEYRAVQARAMQQQQDATLRYTSRTNELTGQHSKEKMAAVTWYERKLAVLDNKKEMSQAQAKQALIKAQAEKENAANKARENQRVEMERLTTRFDKMEVQIGIRQKETLARLDQEEKKLRAAAEKTFQQAKEKAEKMVATSKHAREVGTKKANRLFDMAKKAKSKSIKSSENIGGAELNFKQAEQDREKKVKMDVSRLATEKNKFKLEVKTEQKEVMEKERVRDQANAAQGSLSEAEFRKRQETWLATVKKTAEKNCEDAKKEGILQTRAGRIANLRLVRMARDTKKMKEMVLEDLKTKNKRSFDVKEKAQKHLKKVVKASADAMKASPSSYDASAVQKAAVEYSKVAGPEKSQEEQIKEATEKVKEATESVEKHSDAWMKGTNAANAATLKETADATCRKEQHKYQTVKYRVGKRLGTATEADEKALAKREHDDKKWANKQVSVMIGQGKALNEAGAKKEAQLNAEMQRANLHAESDQKRKVQELKQKARKSGDMSKAKQLEGEQIMRDIARSESIKIEESERTLQSSENSFKNQQKTATQKMEQGKRSITEETKTERADLIRRKRQAIHLLNQNSKSSETDSTYERAEKKSKQMMETANGNHQELITKFTQKKEHQTEVSNKKLEKGKDAAKERLDKATADINNRLAAAKVVLSKKNSEANHLDAESKRRNGGARTSVQFDAQNKADAEIAKTSREAEVEIEKAKNKFSTEVADATDKQTRDIAQAKKDVIASYEGFSNDKFEQGVRPARL